MTKPLGIFTLFHADVPHLRAARDRVLAGLFSGYDDDVLTPTDATFNFRLHLNGLSFAHTDDKTISTNTNNTNNTKKNEETCAALKTLRLTPAYTLYNTHTGCAVPASMVGKQLVERVLDMIVLERVEFARVLETISERAGRENDVEIMNFGPGMGLARVAMRTLKERVSGVSFAINDVSNSSAISAKGKPTFVTKDSQEPIAIVGMAVNFPGARDTSELWSVLENGINTVEEVRHFDSDHRSTALISSRSNNYIAFENVFLAFSDTSDAVLYLAVFRCEPQREFQQEDEDAFRVLPAR